MGGPGSGNWCRWGAKSTTESQCQIDIRWLKKKECLRPGITGSFSWSSGGEQTGSIGYKMEAEQMILNYRHLLHDNECEDVQQTIPFVRTPCNYGGFRTWFLCPRCQKRVAVLYGPGKYFLCRHCYNLTYSCQQQTPPFRLMSKAKKIRKRLGASRNIDEAILFRPRGMHKKTFNRLRNEAYKASDQSWQEMAKRLGK